MFDLNFKTKTIKTYGKRGRRVVSYIEKNSDFDRLAAETKQANALLVKPTSSDSHETIVNTKQLHDLPTPPADIYQFQDPLPKAYTSDEPKLPSPTPKTTQCLNVAETLEISPSIELEKSDQSRRSTDSPVSPERPKESSIFAVESSLDIPIEENYLTEALECPSTSPKRIDNITTPGQTDAEGISADIHSNSIVSEITHSLNDTPEEPTGLDERVPSPPISEPSPIKAHPLAKFKSIAMAEETAAMPDFLSPLRTRSGRQLRQTYANVKKMPLVKRESLQTPRKSDDITEDTPIDQPILATKNLKRIIVNSPKPYKFSPFRKRAALEPCKLKNFEVLVTPRRLRSQPRVNEPLPETYHSPMKIDPRTPVAVSTPLSRSSVGLTSPGSGCMSGSPFKRRISTLARSNVSKDIIVQDGDSTTIAASTNQSKVKVLEDLINLFGQSSVATFESFLGSDSLATITKIGEATFSEVFSCRHAPLSSSVALKVLPFGKGKEVPVNGETQKSAHEIYQEASIALTLSNLGTSGINSDAADRSHFIQVHKVGICQGKYPQELLAQWDEWAETNITENERPDFFAEDQLYCVFVLDHGGKDLEHVKLKSWDQAESVFTQVVYSMSLAEKHLNFEHRDLHWGNIMVAPTDQEYFDFSEPNGETFRVPSFGIRASIIDYTLSRLERNQDIFYVNIDDEEIFAGEGDYQFEIYRKMESETGRNWSGYYPRTNIYWFHYLNDKLLNSKRLLKRAVARRPLASLQERILNYKSVLELLNDPHFDKNREIDEKLSSGLKQLSLQ